MYFEHDLFEKPDDENTRIWRYLDFTKFVYLLQNEALFFARADKFGDKFEGSFPKITIQSREEKFDQKYSDMISRYAKEFKKVILINCWHMNDFESEAMWKLYLRYNEGVAIQSTYKRLVDSMERDKINQVFIGKVKYIDYNSQFFQEGNIFLPYLFKRKSFEHERELRAITLYQDANVNSSEFLIKDFDINGIDITVDLNVLIEQVFVSPYAKKWFFNLVKSIMKKYEFSFEPSQSSLMDDPLY
jgi:hypothetical protein